MPIPEHIQRHLRMFKIARPEWALVCLEHQYADESFNEKPKAAYPRANPYLSGMVWTLERIARRGDSKVLDIGSPLAQSIAINHLPGIDLTVVDVRTHPDADLIKLKWVHSNGTHLPFEDKSWPTVVCNWVLGHVGDGRYGDPYDVDGDKNLLREIARVCSDYAIVGVGLIDDHCTNIFNLHRIYSWRWLAEVFDECGLEIIERAELPVEDDVYFGASFTDRSDLIRRAGFYGIVSCRPK